MRILLVVDGSSYSDTATRTLEALKLPTETEVTVMTVVPEHTFLGGISLDKLRGTASAERKEEEEKAVKLLSGPVELLSAGGLKVEGLVRRGNPAEVILKVAEQKSYSLVVMGTKGLTDPLPFRLGSVAQSVARHATASVLLARPKTLTLHRVSPSRDKSLSIDRVLFATDGSKYSGAAAQFLLDLPLPRSTQVMVLTALQSHTASLLKVPTLDFETNRQLLADLQAAEEKEARKLLDRARQGFQDHGYKTASVVVRGGASECILETAQEHDSDIIALGYRGLSGIESFILGSVSERVARYAPCSVLIVRPEKPGKH